MFGSLLRWLHASSLQRRRQIFRYFDGRAMRFADPLAVLRALDTHPEYVEEKHYDAALRFGEKGTSSATIEERRRFHEAARVCDSAIRFAFGIRSFDEGGLSVGESLDLLTAFVEYRDGVKKHQAFADVSGLFGCDAARLEWSDYERFVGLYLLRPRISAQRADAVRRGYVAGRIGIEFGAVVDPELIYATTDTDEQAIYEEDVQDDFYADVARSRAGGV